MVHAMVTTVLETSRGGRYASSTATARGTQKMAAAPIVATVIRENVVEQDCLKTTDKSPLTLPEADQRSIMNELQRVTLERMARNDSGNPILHNLPWLTLGQRQGRDSATNTILIMEFFLTENQRAQTKFAVFGNVFVVSAWAIWGAGFALLVSVHRIMNPPLDGFSPYAP